MKVLYAEDDPLTVMEVAEQLEERGFEVIVATNGTEALKLFRERQPNVVLLDVDMPVIMGLRCCKLSGLPTAIHR